MILITRPLEDAVPLAEQLQKIGFETLIEPVLTVQALPVSLPENTDFQAVLCTSGNAVRALGKHRVSAPFYGVGAATAKLAKAAGFMPVQPAQQDMQALKAYVIRHLNPNNGPLLYLKGAHTTGNLDKDLQAVGFQVIARVLYESKPVLHFSADCLAAFRAHHIHAVLLYSVRTAHFFSKLIADYGLSAVSQDVPAFCLSPSIAKALGNWACVHISDTPDQEALITLLKRQYKSL